MTRIKMEFLRGNTVRYGVLEVQETDGGYDYTLYDAIRYPDADAVIDGGVFENNEMTEEMAVEEAMAMLDPWVKCKEQPEWQEEDR